MLAGVLAVFLLTQSAGCDAERGTALAQAGREALRTRQFEAALANFTGAIGACPGNRNLLLERANALLMSGRFRDAQAASSEVLRTDPANAAALKIRGNAEYLLGSFTDARNTFITLLDKHPEDEDGAYMLGRIYYQEGQVDQALGQFQRVLRLNSRSYKAWDNLGLCWQAIGDNKKAVAHFLKAISLVEKDHPEYDWAYANLADLLIQTGDVEHAFAAASKAADRNPNSARNFYIGAKALDKLGKTELCLNWLQRSAALDPAYSEPHYMLMRIYKRLGQEDKAEQERKTFQALKAKEPAKRR